MEPTNARQRLLSNEFPGGEQRNRGFLAFPRNDREFCAARPKLEDGVSRASLRKEVLLWLQVDDFSSHSCIFQKGDEVKGHALTPDTSMGRPGCGLHGSSSEAYATASDLRKPGLSFWLPECPPFYAHSQ